nr:YsnF/AvaK domain-containing protein [Paracraurococcus ruber]
MRLSRRRPRRNGDRMAEPERTGRLVEERVVPVVEETAVVTKEQLVTDRVRLHKRVHAERQRLDIPVRTESLEIARIPVGRFVEAAPAVRQVGDTTIHPVVEEVLVVEKRLRLVEEVHVTRRQTTRQVRDEVTLRREEVTVEHLTDPHATERNGPG